KPLTVATGAGGLAISAAMQRQFARIKTTPPGPRSRALVEGEKPHLAPGTQGVWQLAGIAAERGQGALLEDVDGNQYIDLVAGICVASLGYGHKRQAQAIAAPAQKLAVGSFTTAPRAALLKTTPSPTPKRAGP